MATTATVTLDTMRAEVNQVEGEISREKQKLADAECELDALEVEKGAVDVAKVGAVITKIGTQQEIIRRQREKIRAKEPRLVELWRTIRSEEAAANRNSLLAEVGKLSTDGLAAINRIEAAFASTATDFDLLRKVRTALEAHSQGGLWAPMRGQPIPEASQHANAALTEFGNRLRLLSERTGWTPKR